MTELNASNKEDGIKILNDAVNKKRKILHVVVGDDDWVPSKEQVDEVSRLFSSALNNSEDTVVATTKGVTVFEISDYDEVQAHSIKDIFNSTDIRRVDNNPAEELNNYSGPDDVALRYHALSDPEKTKMLRVKLATQYLINELRDLGSHRDIDLAIEHAQDASMRGVRFITQSSKQ